MFDISKDKYLATTTLIADDGPARFSAEMGIHAILRMHHIHCLQERMGRQIFVVWLIKHIIEDQLNPSKEHFSWMCHFTI